MSHGLGPRATEEPRAVRGQHPALNRADVWEVVLMQGTGAFRRVFTQDQTGHSVKTATPSPRCRQQREKVRSGLDTDSAGTAQLRQQRSQARTCLPENPLPILGLPGALTWPGRGWEGQQGRRDGPVGSGHASALPTTLSRAPRHVHMPLGAGQMFSFRSQHGARAA